MHYVTRDAPEGSVYFRFFDHNPPRYRDAWVNENVLGALSRTYNRERQGAITTELNEIIGGAAALEDM